MSIKLVSYFVCLSLIAASAGPSAQAAPVAPAVGLADAQHARAATTVTRVGCDPVSCDYGSYAGYLYDGYRYDTYGYNAPRRYYGYYNAPYGAYYTAPRYYVRPYVNYYYSAPAYYYAPPVVEAVPEVPYRPASCGRYRFWDGYECVDARVRRPDLRARW